MQQGHDNEIAALYAENRVALLRRAYKYMNDWDAASDVVQTSMLKFIRMFGKLSRLTHQEKTGYLFTIVRHTAFEELKKKKPSRRRQKLRKRTGNSRARRTTSKARS